MFNASYKIATVFGIPIKLHVSVLILILIYLFDFPFPYGILVGLGILMSIALHELGHSLVAISKKCRVREITLMFMGGVAQMESIPRKPLDEFLMAVAGPLVSLGLGLTLISAGLRFPLPPIPGIGWNYFFFMGVANTFLAVFNMLPAFPMDGGRVLRAGLTPWLGRLKATRIAASIGKFAALVFAFLGIRYGEFIFIAIAIFIYFAASQEYRMVLMQERGRRFGIWDWINQAAGRPQPPRADEDDQVLISPPPYEKGPSSRSRLTEDDDNPMNPFLR